MMNMAYKSTIVEIKGGLKLDKSLSDLSVKSLGYIRIIAHFGQFVNNKTVSISKNFIEKNFKISHHTQNKIIEELYAKRVIISIRGNTLIFKKPLFNGNIYFLDDKSMFSDLKLSEHGILMYLLYFRNSKTNSTYVTNQTLCEYSGLSRRQVQYILKRLEEKGLIRITNNEYRIIEFPLIKHRQKLHPHRQKLHPYTPKTAENSAKIAPKQYINNKLLNSNLDIKYYNNKTNNNIKQRDFDFFDLESIEIKDNAIN